MTTTLKRTKFKKFEFFDLVVYVLLTLFALIIFVPFFSVIMISFTTEKEILSKPFVLIPSEWTLSSYKEIFSDTLLRTGLISSMIVTYFGVFLNVALTLLAAYAFSKPKFPGRKALYYVFIFTMFFSGGMIPSYLLIKDLGLIDSILSLILPTTLSIFSMILVKTYVEGLPKELRESAEIDGANEFVIFFKIILPLCGPVIATVSLFYAVDRWNDWFNAMLYINTDSMYPIQLVLRNIVNSATSKDIEQATGNIRVYGEGIKMATIIVVMGPIMIVYPFLQKYFMKGVMVGAIKG